MEVKNNNIGFNTGLAIGSTLAVACMLFALSLIFFPPLATALSVTMLGIKMLECMLALNGFFMVLGMMTLHDTTMRRQAKLDDNKPHYPLGLGIFGATLAYTFAGFGKLIEKGWHKLFNSKNRNSHVTTGSSTDLIQTTIQAKRKRSHTITGGYPVNLALEGIKAQRGVKIKENKASHLSKVKKPVNSAQPGFKLPSH